MKNIRDRLLAPAVLVGLALVAACDHRGASLDSTAALQAQMAAVFNAVDKVQTQSFVQEAVKRHKEMDISETFTSALKGVTNAPFSIGTHTFSHLKDLIDNDRTLQDNIGSMPGNIGSAEQFFERSGFNARLITEDDLMLYYQTNSSFLLAKTGLAKQTAGTGVSPDSLDLARNLNTLVFFSALNELLASAESEKNAVGLLGLQDALLFFDVGGQLSISATNEAGAQAYAQNAKASGLTELYQIFTGLAASGAQNAVIAAHTPPNNETSCDGHVGETNGNGSGGLFQCIKLPTGSTGSTCWYNTTDPCSNVACYNPAVLKKPTTCYH